MFLKNLFMSIRHMKKNIEIPGSHYFSFFTLSNLFTQTDLNFCTTGQLTSSEHAKFTFKTLSTERYGSVQYVTVQFGTEHSDPFCVSTANSTLT